LRVGDALLAGISGAVVALIVLFSLYLRVDPGISGQLAAWSYAEAYGRNVVNVILVDFRALDTLGEILVLAIASIGVFLLLRAGRLHQSRAKLKKTEEQTT
jgi:multicomponent Na+:H+ antiporter subunit A